MDNTEHMKTLQIKNKICNLKEFFSMLKIKRGN
jgi:hypothetical protein